MHVPETTLDPFREGSVEVRVAAASTPTWPAAVATFLTDMDFRFSAQVTPYRISRSVIDPTPLTQSLLSVHWELDDDSFADGGWLLPMWFASMQFREPVPLGQQIVGISFDPLGGATEYRTTHLGLLWGKESEIPFDELDQIIETGTTES